MFGFYETQGGASMDGQRGNDLRSVQVFKLNVQHSPAPLTQGIADDAGVQKLELY
jgi:hypothetical protein